MHAYKTTYLWHNIRLIYVNMLYVLIEFIRLLNILTDQQVVFSFVFFPFTSQSYVSAHPSIVLLDPLPAMTQLLDRFASYRIMTKLHNSLRGKLQRHDVDAS